MTRGTLDSTLEINSLPKIAALKWYTAGLKSHWVLLETSIVFGSSPVLAFESSVLRGPFYAPFKMVGFENGLQALPEASTM
jgi:hypothetical protein